MPHSDFASAGAQESSTLLSGLLGGFANFAFVVSCARLRDNPILFCSDEFVSLTGCATDYLCGELLTGSPHRYSREEIIGRNCRFLQCPETDKTKISAIRDAVREEKPITVCLRNYKKDGTPFWNLLHVCPIADMSGQVAWYFGVQTAVSDEAAAALMASEGARLVPTGEPLEVFTRVPSVDRNVADNCVHLRSTLETGARRLSLDAARRSRASFDSRASRELSRFTRCSLDAASMARSSSSVSASSSSMHRVSSGGAQGGGLGAGALPPVPGSPLVEEVALPPCLVPLAGAVCTAERVSSPLLSQLVKVQQALCISDPSLPDCPIIHASQAFLDMTGFPAEEVLGFNCRFLQGPGTDPRAVAKLRDAGEKNEPVTVQLLNYRKNGEPFWNCVHIAPLRDGTGKAVLFVGVQMDVTAAMEGGAKALEQPAAEGASGGEVTFDTEAMPFVHLGHMAAVGKVRMAVRGLGSRSLVRKESSCGAP